MGEDQKEEEEKKEEEKKEEEPPEMVLRVDMHCEACARKVEKSLRKCEGVEEVRTESMLRQVVVKGKGVDPSKLCERVLKKTGRRAEIISPLPKPTPEGGEKKEEAPPEEENKEEPKLVTVVLRVLMHCQNCAQVLQKRIKKMQGVETVVTDIPNGQVTVTGFIDPAALVEEVSRRTRRRASIVLVEEEKKDEEAVKEEEGEKKGDEGEGEKKLEYWPSKHYLEYAYAYPPQDFSDENPNACSVM